MNNGNTDKKDMDEYYRLEMDRPGEFQGVQSSSQDSEKGFSDRRSRYNSRKHSASEETEEGKEKGEEAKC